MRICILFDTYIKKLMAVNNTINYLQIILFHTVRIKNIILGMSYQILSHFVKMH